MFHPYPDRYPLPWIDRCKAACALAACTILLACTVNAAPVATPVATPIKFKATVTSASCLLGYCLGYMDAFVKVNGKSYYVFGPVRGWGYKTGTALTCTASLNTIKHTFSGVTCRKA